MIVRYTFMRVLPEFGDAAGLSELRAHALALRDIDGVKGVSVGVPADAHARSAWDLSVVLQCDGQDALQRISADSAFVAYEAFVATRVRVIKNWNFEQ